MTRYYGWCASRTKGMRRRQAAGGAEIDTRILVHRARSREPGAASEGRTAVL